MSMERLRDPETRDAERPSCSCVAAMTQNPRQSLPHLPLRCHGPKPEPGWRGLRADELRQGRSGGGRRGRGRARRLEPPPDVGNLPRTGAGRAPGAARGAGRAGWRGAAPGLPPRRGPQQVGAAGGGRLPQHRPAGRGEGKPGRGGQRAVSASRRRVRGPCAAPGPAAAPPAGAACAPRGPAGALGTEPAAAAAPQLGPGQCEAAPALCPGALSGRRRILGRAGRRARRGRMSRHGSLHRRLRSGSLSAAAERAAGSPRRPQALAPPGEAVHPPASVTCASPGPPGRGRPESADKMEISFPR